MKHIPNLISLSRILMILISFFFLNSYLFLSVLSLYIILSDHLDGYIARKYQLTSPLGASLDHISDKISNVFFLLLFLHINIFNIFIVFLLILRDFLSDFIKTDFIRNQKELPSSYLAKIKTTTSFIIFSILLISFNYNFYLNYLTNISIIILIFLNYITLYDYIKNWKNLLKNII